MGADTLPVRKRIAFISQGLGRIEPPKAYGSISLWTYETARHLSRDCSVLMVEFGNQNFGTRVLEHEGSTYLYVPAALNRVINAAHRILSRFARLFQSQEDRIRRPQYASVFHNLGYIIQAAWVARRWRCDVIHIHNFSQFVPVIRAFNPKAFVALHMHCEWLSQHSYRMIEQRINKVDAVLCCSGHIRRRLLESFPAMRGRSHVVFNGVNVERFLPSTEPPNESKEDLRVLFVGRISPEKGVHLLVEAFASVAARFPRAYLDLVGGVGSLPAEFLVNLSRDPLVRQLEAFYKTDYLAEVKRRIPVKLNDRVIFHGSVIHEELAQIYRNAAVFVSPSLSDAFPLTVVEAMAAGLPVVASRVGGIPEAVVDGETGLLVEPDNAGAFAAALSRVLMDSEMRRRMSAAARNRAAELYSWRAISQQVALAYSGTVQVGVDTQVDYASADAGN